MQNPHLTTLLSGHIKLPKHFTEQEVLAFHQRDSAAIAERVSGHTIEKGMIWDGFPACLRLVFNKGKVAVSLAVDGAVTADNKPLLTMARRMLGLTQAVEKFENTYQDHPLLASIIAQHKGLRVPQTASPFEAIVWAIIGQQISVSAAIAIRRRLIQLVNIPHSSGLLCHPDAQTLSTLSEETLCPAGLSKTKARTINLVSQQITSQQIPLASWEQSTNPPADEITQALLSIKGIGPWTMSYVLLRGFGSLNGSLHGDVAVRRSLQRLLQRNEKITAEETAQWLNQFQPWRALVAAHLWKLLSDTAY